MNIEEKNLLLKDLCDRLAYDVTYYHDTDNVVTPKQILGLTEINNILIGIGDNIKPYLRPMSSMTEEEFQRLHSICPNATFNKTNESGWVIGIYGSECGRISHIDEISILIDWLNEHHFDYRGLIEKGLALEAPDGMYK